MDLETLLAKKAAEWYKRQMQEQNEPNPIRGLGQNTANLVEIVDAGIKMNMSFKQPTR